MDESALIQDARAGDLDAFNRLVLAYQELAYNLAFRMLSEQEAAADVTQDAFISAYKSLGSYRGGSFRAWLLRIVTNGCYDELRRRHRRPAG
jgi:RNA polymerase sigma factor (sigma-70 family)